MPPSTRSAEPLRRIKPHSKNPRLPGSRGFFCCPKRAMPFWDKSLAEFAARRRQSKCNPFFAAACTSQKTLLSLQVWNLFAFSEQIMRAADCKPIVQKGFAFLDKIRIAPRWRTWPGRPARPRRTAWPPRPGSSGRSPAPGGWWPPPPRRGYTAG